MAAFSGGTTGFSRDVAADVKSGSSRPGSGIGTTQENNFRDDNRQTFVRGDRTSAPTGSDPGFLAAAPVVSTGLGISSVLQELLGPPTGGSTMAGPAGEANKDPFRDDERSQLLSRAGIDPDTTTITEEQADALREADRGFERDANLNMFNRNIDQGVSGLRSAFEREIRRRGLANADEDFSGLLESRIGEIRGQLPSYSGEGSLPNVSQYFDPNIAADVLDLEQQSRRNQFLNDISGRFGSGFELEAIPGTFDDAAIGQLVDQGLGDAMRALDRSRARGQLTDQGFNRAASEVQGQAGEARTQLDTAGQGVLEDLRSQLSQIAQQARTGASNFKLGQQFSPSTFFNEADAITQSPAADIVSRIRSQVPVEGLFDPQSAITIGGGQQGFVNPGRNALIGAFANRVGDDRNQRRGVGSRGVF